MKSYELLEKVHIKLKEFKLNSYAIDYYINNDRPITSGDIAINVVVVHSDAPSFIENMIAFYKKLKITGHDVQWNNQDGLTNIRFRIKTLLD